MPISRLPSGIRLQGGVLQAGRCCLLSFFSLSCVSALSWLICTHFLVVYSEMMYICAGLRCNRCFAVAVSKRESGRNPELYP